MPPLENDEEIILSFLSGNQEAFRELVNRYTPSMFNFAARLAGKDQANDIAQEIFIKVWKNIGHFNPKKASFKTWIFTIAKNTTTDFLRKRKDYSFSEIEKYNAAEDDSFSLSIPDETLLPDEALQKIQDKEFLEKILNKLHRNYREVLLLHYQEEMTFEEIGKILERPLNTIKSQHRRALVELRQML